ncbi:hypothetical protein NHQ30_000627 [Ciborinia camelliae]|nr:hypothetical protein NHQ30_000627 [Ciborinia camelliae]
MERVNRGKSVCGMEEDRNMLITLRQSNGGEVTKIEKNAEILIADDARKDTPPGSISWKFIEESTKAGELVDIEKYRCGAPVGAIEKQGSATAKPAKTTRTPFTTEDDRILTEWVLEAERNGRSTKGNKIYMELMELHPHHTYQSWLDRWKRHLLLHHETGLLHYETKDGDLPSPERQPRTGSAKPPAKKPSHDSVKAGETTKERVQVSASYPPKRSSSQPSTRSILEAPSPEVRIRNPIAGQPFTENDDRLLRKEFKDICEVSSDEEIEAWEKWTEEHGHHTAQEWRNYFHHDFCPREIKARKEKKEAKTKPVLSTTSREVSSSSKDKYTKTSTRTKHSTNKNEKVPVETAVRSSVTPSPYAKSKVDHEPKTPGVMPRKINLEKRPFANFLLKEEDYFTQTLKDFSGELSKDLNFHPQIRGKKVSIFKLWQIVMLFGGFDKTSAEKRWQEIADRLSFPIANRAKAAEDLKNCYDEILSEFETSIVEVENDEDNPEFTASQDETLLASHLEDTISRSAQRPTGHEVETENNDQILYLPQQLAKSKQLSTMSTKKRAINSDDLSNHSGPSLPNVKPQSKRPKVDKGKGKEVEIPPTPEHVYNATKRTLSFEGDDDSSSDREAQERIRRIQQGSSRKASAKKPVLEPETQDFQYSDINDEVSIASPTPAPKKMTKATVIDLSRDSSSESELEQDSDSQNSLQADFDKYKALGYSDEIIANALEATTFDFEIASVVMEQLKNGHSIPDDMAGVWTKRDDEALFSEDSAERKRILTKHGKDGIAARKEFKRGLTEIEEV